MHRKLAAVLHDSFKAGFPVEALAIKQTNSGALQVASCLESSYRISDFLLES